MNLRPLLLPPLLFGMIAGTAQAAAPGARPGDKEMTCEAVEAERVAIDADVAKRAEKQAAGERRKQGLMRFAQGAAPALLGQLGAGSQTGSIAAQAVGQGAFQALGDGASAESAKRSASATPEQQARLDRLDRIAAYRQCAS